MFIRIVNITLTCYCPIKDLVNSDIRVKDTKQSSSLHQTTSKLPLYQRGIYYMGIKILK